MSQHIYTYDPVNGLEEIGGAGHIIEDAAGVTYAKRENLQFEGASVTDDSTNNKTVVTITETNFVGTMAEWNALTADEKAQYKTVDLTDDFNGEPIDSELSTTSEHTVQNKVVTAAINGKAQTDHASSSATYGLGTAANYGHNKIIDNLTKTSLTSGEALSAHMGNTLGKMFAPIEAGPKYSTSYAAGTQFVYNGILYKTTTAVTSASDINTGSGGNATAAGNITSQISNLESKVNDKYLLLGTKVVTLATGNGSRTCNTLMTLALTALNAIVPSSEVAGATHMKPVYCALPYADGAGTRTILIPESGLSPVASFSSSSYKFIKVDASSTGDGITLWNADFGSTNRWFLQSVTTGALSDFLTRKPSNGTTLDVCLEFYAKY